MKTTMRLISSMLLLVIIVSAIASCSPTISGTYYSGDKTITNTYVQMSFSGSNVTITSFAVGKKVFETTAKYTLDNDGSKITITVPEDADAAAKVYNGEFAFSKTDDSVKIGLVTYKKG